MRKSSRRENRSASQMFNSSCNNNQQQGCKNLQFLKNPTLRVFRFQFLRTNAAMLSAHLSYRNSVCPSVRPSVTRVDQAKTVRGRITKSSPSAARKTLVSGTVKLFHKFEGGHPERGP